jgi:predicted RNase H-like HicB family nuclease
MGQLVEWPEVVTEGKDIEDCRELLRDALLEMIEAYKQQGKELPVGGDLLEQVAVEA